jgi:hypothetical protein
LQQRLLDVPTRGRNTVGAQTVATPLDEDYDYDLGIDEIDKPTS